MVRKRSILLLEILIAATLSAVLFSALLSQLFQLKRVSAQLETIAESAYSRAERYALLSYLFEAMDSDTPEFHIKDNALSFRCRPTVQKDLNLGESFYVALYCTKNSELILKKTSLDERVTKSAVLGRHIDHFSIRCLYEQEGKRFTSKPTQEVPTFVQVYIDRDTYPFFLQKSAIAFDYR